LAVAGILLLGSGAPGADVDPEAVDPQLNTVVSVGKWRFLSYLVCSPEHCWSESFVQEFSDDVEPRVKVTCPITEIQVGYSVQAAEWQWRDEQWVLRLGVAASHGGFEPHALLLWPAEGCEYTLAREEGAA
jgi:hypothetical protein